MTKTSLETLLLICSPESVRDAITEIRKPQEDKETRLDAIAAHSFKSNDPTRQLFRKAMRYAVDTPDEEWEHLLAVKQVMD